MESLSYLRWVIGKALFEEIERGQTSGIQDGMLKIVSDPAGESILGAMVIGAGTTELIHIGPMECSQMLVLTCLSKVFLISNTG